MPPYISTDHAHRSFGPVDRAALAEKLPSRAQRGLLRMGLVRSDRWKQLPAEGLYQLVISEVLDNGLTYPLERSGGRAFAVTSVLDLGLRMMESERGKQALENLARKAICIWRERPVPGPVVEPWVVDVPAAVEEFLRCVRYRFPIVKLDDRNGFCHEEENKTMPYSWVDEYSTLEQFDFNPKAAAVLHLNWQLVEKLYWTRLKADVARRQQREDERLAETVRFHRLQFHLGAMVTHHLCHLFVNFLRGSDDLLARGITDTDFLRLVRRYDPGAEFEIDFFGGRPKLFIDRSAASGQSYEGQSYVIKRGRGGGRMAAVVAQYKIESYLKGDFSVPLLTEVQSEVFPMERYQEVLRRHGASWRGSSSKDEDGEWREGQTPGGPRRVATTGGSSSFEHRRIGSNITSMGSGRSRTAAAGAYSVPWDVKGTEYQMLKQACFDPCVKVVDPRGV